MRCGWLLSTLIAASPLFVTASGSLAVDPQTLAIAMRSQAQKSSFALNGVALSFFHYWKDRVHQRPRRRASSLIVGEAEYYAFQNFTASALAQINDYHQGKPLDPKVADYLRMYESLTPP